jgi:hypothetical protein
MVGTSRKQKGIEDIAAFKRQEYQKLINSAMTPEELLFSGQRGLRVFLPRSFLKLSEWLSSWLLHISKGMSKIACSTFLPKKPSKRRRLTNPTPEGDR